MDAAAGWASEPVSQWARTDGPPRKRQRTAALQNLAAVGGRPESRQRLGVRQSSAAFPRVARRCQRRPFVLAAGLDHLCQHCDATLEAEAERAGEEAETVFAVL